jgi:hypothetical protein
MAGSQSGNEPNGLLSQFSASPRLPRIGKASGQEPSGQQHWTPQPKALNALYADFVEANETARSEFLRLVSSTGHMPSILDERDSGMRHSLPTSRRILAPGVSQRRLASHSASGVPA